ncbi:hypothetical protein BJ138DRAFT_1146612 [Hygrophoropsis aurantiaca]|uniref:Uncharacterized protein n=1 Tax=Hygrophoropsis aurantiaca TaxID=72124 RepID=A0ACB8AJ87_9AGAM|nr:hypothetical protein BJ138DRAFT_1146612 [Hygrophoropsis aurantiaca]
MDIHAHPVFSNVYILTKILSALPDFSGLYRAIAISKSFYHAYQAYPQSITRSVAFNLNLFDSTLPSALRLVRCQLANFEFPGANEDAPRFEPPGSPAYDEEDLTNDHILNLSCEEIRALADRQKVVQSIEDIFSSREKDRRFTTSQLTHVESTRFRRAMYRTWLFCATYGCEAYDKNQGYGDGEYDDDANEENLEHQKGFLKAFSTPELHEIITVAAFLQHMATWAENAGFLKSAELLSEHLIDDWASYALFHGPQAVLRAQLNDLTWLCTDYHEHLYPRIDGFLFLAISDVLDDRDQEPEATLRTRKTVIDECIGEGDICQRCQSGNVFAKYLWNINNWGYLRGFQPPKALQTQLKGYLSCNIAETDGFIEACEKTPYTVLFGEILDLYNANDDAKQSKDDWLCEDCLMIFAHDYLHLWFLQWKRKEGLYVSEDNCRCSAGCDCVIQTHDVEHAQKYNHWCDPMRKDGTGAN